MVLSTLNSDWLSDIEKAFAWRKSLDLPYAWCASEHDKKKDVSAEQRSISEKSQTDEILSLMLPKLEMSPIESMEEIVLTRDFNGKPILNWTPAGLQRARIHGIDPERLHISNTNDGGISLFLTAYSRTLLGVGIDLVALKRLRTINKDRDYFFRFSRQFMSHQELDKFESDAVDDSLDRLCIRAAAHFSLMESISKALGTGLKIGAGMGRKISLPKQAIGISSLSPQVDILLEKEASERVKLLGGSRMEAFWGVGDEYLVSAALLWE